MNSSDWTVIVSCKVEKLAVNWSCGEIIFYFHMKTGANIVAIMKPHVKLEWMGNHIQQMGNDLRWLKVDS